MHSHCETVETNALRWISVCGWPEALEPCLWQPRKNAVDGARDIILDVLQRILLVALCKAGLFVAVTCWHR